MNDDRWQFFIKMTDYWQKKLFPVWTNFEAETCQRMVKMTGTDQNYFWKFPRLDAIADLESKIPNEK